VHRRREPDALRAGDRAPDVAVRGPAGETRLFEMLVRPEWTLVGDALVEGAMSFVDGDGALKASYGTEFVLIRPDGCVALLAGDAAALPSSVYGLLGSAVA
jgi:hypothetical protein